MPISDFIKQHLSAADKAAIDAHLEGIRNILLPRTCNLTPGERQKYGCVNEYNKLLIQKVRDYRLSQPGMASPDVDWDEFEDDYQDRNYYENFITHLALLMEMADDTKKLHDFDVYRAALTDYGYTKYKTGTDSPGYDSKHRDIRQFFPNTGGRGGNRSAPA